MSDHERDSDDELLAELREALVAPTPGAETLQIEKSLFTWRSIDSELATLTHDSTVAEPAATMRSETATLRTMTFEAPSFTVELGITPVGLVGQLVPPSRGSAWLRTADGTTDPVQIDDLGCFTIEPRPHVPFSLACSTAAGLRVLTDWVSP
ncbi:MAG: hypothetical protein QOC93_2563 [Actinomycetota bacterium]|jgi:hypothetical protein|nr:hypothetical protein [Cryptosporangiaceae bacterium]MDQ1677419.1 hypothetical protein [Actinomycetota bacterium]